MENIVFKAGNLRAKKTGYRKYMKERALDGRTRQRHTSSDARI